MQLPIFTHSQSRPSALVRLIDALYLIFKFAVVPRESLDDNIRCVRHIQTNRACKKQPLANLEFVLGHTG
jgi:hypothetical protein